MSPLVLAYHAVARRPFAGMAREMVVTADELAAEVERLRASGREFRLTFDDGWADALTVAAPVLLELGVGATFFLCPGLFGNAEASGFSPEGRVLTREEAGELAALGFDLGAHSMTHPDLVECSDEELRTQLRDSKAQVEAVSGRPCTEFAYQYAPGPWEPFAAPRVPMPAY